MAQPEGMVTTTYLNKNYVFANCTPSYIIDKYGIEAHLRFQRRGKRVKYFYEAKLI